MSMPFSHFVIIAGSTLRGEEEAVIRAFNRVRASGVNALLVIAARHPERFSEVERVSGNWGPEGKTIYGVVYARA